MSNSVVVKGFLSNRFESLPHSVLIVLGVYLVSVALALLIVGARSLHFLRDLGTTYGGGTNDKDTRGAWLRGGLGGTLVGSIALGIVVTAFLLLIVERGNRQSSLGPWATIAIPVVCAVPGAVAGARWAWFSKSSVAFVASVSSSLVLIVSFRIASTLCRNVIAVVSIVVSLVSVHVRNGRARRYALAVASALSGSFAFVVAVDFFLLLSSSDAIGFVDAVGLFVSRRGVRAFDPSDNTVVVVVEWESSRAKGLIAAWWILTIASASWQSWWGLGGGIEGQELWDDYLSKYWQAEVSTRDADQTRLGTQSPPRTLWTRLLSKMTLNRRDAFSSNRRRRGLTTTTTTPWDDHESDFDDVDDDSDSEFEKKGGGFQLAAARPRRDTDDVETIASRRRRRRQRSRRRHASKPATYREALRESDHGDQDDDEEEGIMGRRDAIVDGASSLKSFGALSGSTFVGDDDDDAHDSEVEEIEKVRRQERTIDTGRGGTTRTKSLPSSLDQQDDLEEGGGQERELELTMPTKRGTSELRGSTSAAEQLASPRSMTRSRRQFTSPESPPRRPPHCRDVLSETPTTRDQGQDDDAEGGVDELRSVPATRSLLTAIRRVNQAQRQARDLVPRLRTSDAPRPAEVGDVIARGEDVVVSPGNDRRARRASMDEFWKSVVERASSR